MRVLKNASAVRAVVMHRSFRTGLLVTAAPRADLDLQLSKLREMLPALVEQFHDDDDFLKAYVQRADEIADYALPEDHSWVHDRVVQMLSEMGKLRRCIYRRRVLEMG